MEMTSLKNDRPNSRAGQMTGFRPVPWFCQPCYLVLSFSNPAFATASGWPLVEHTLCVPR